MFFDCEMKAAEILPLFEAHQRHLVELEAKELGDVFRFFEWDGTETQMPK